MKKTENLLLWKKETKHSQEKSSKQQGLTMGQWRVIARHTHCTLLLQIPICANGMNMRRASDGEKKHTQQAQYRQLFVP